jgi:hypothetical protein
MGVSDIGARRWARPWAAVSFDTEVLLATYAAVHGVMLAIAGALQEQLPAELRGTPVNGSVQVFGSLDFKRTGIGNVLALYLYRVSVDPTIPGGRIPAPPGHAGGRIPEVPVMLHFLMIAIGDTALAENSLMSWGFWYLAAYPTIGPDRLTDPALAWDDGDDAQIATEELTREELMRIWDTLPMKYTQTVPFVIRGVRIGLLPDLREYPPVRDTTFVSAPNS